MNYLTRNDKLQRRYIGPGNMGGKCGRGWIGLKGACKRAKNHGGEEGALKASKVALADKIRKKKGMRDRNEEKSEKLIKVAKWLTEDPKTGKISVPVQAVYSESLKQLSNKPGYEILVEETKKVVGGQPKVSWTRWTTVPIEDWSKVVSDLKKRPEAKHSFEY